MKYYSRSVVSCAVTVLFSLAAAGCQSEPEQQQQVSVEIPEQFEQNGIAWQKQPDIQPSDHQCLEQFFAAKQDLAGSPEFQGQPILFTSGKNDRRFYWLNSTVSTVRWRCVEFRQRKFLMSDGTGNPFK